MRDVILYMSMSLDGFVDSDREHRGVPPHGPRDVPADVVVLAAVERPRTRPQ
jgi:hypothetical protein